MDYAIEPLKRALAETQKVLARAKKDLEYGFLFQETAENQVIELEHQQNQLRDAIDILEGLNSHV